ncbi:MAG: metal ABC transporter substrate-binding protein [Acidimicrobiia bacterium]|nr:metal ABC transporter substrate-binding protein [Acidimicrobiia bacterium]MCY4432838.1 metal ABC transporter substrate-binding protein [bacterium]
MAALALLVSGCGNDDDAASDGSPTIMATTSIWADIVANVACDGQAEVITLIPPGGDPHAFQPSLQDRGRMESAVMIVANGLELEEGLEDTLEAVEEAGTPVFHMADHIETIGFAPGMELEHEGEEEDEEEHHGGDDPHVWFDPIRVADALLPLSEALAAQGGLDSGALSACVTKYRGELVALDDEVAGILAPLPHDERLMLTNHDALGYFANRYEFELVGTVIPGGTSIGEANPAELQELVGLIGQTGVPAIFAESSHSSDDAEALARQAGVDVVVLDTGSLGPSGSGSDTYLGFMRSNAQKIADALG